MNPEKFNPSNPEYKEVKDLPQEHQGEFVDVEGGFVLKEANKESLEDGILIQKMVAEGLADGYRDANSKINKLNSKKSFSHEDLLSIIENTNGVNNEIENILDKKKALILEVQHIQEKLSGANPHNEMVYFRDSLYPEIKKVSWPSREEEKLRNALYGNRMFREEGMLTLEEMVQETRNDVKKMTEELSAYKNEEEVKESLKPLLELQEHEEAEFKYALPRHKELISERKTATIQALVQFVTDDEERLYLACELGMFKGLDNFGNKEEDCPALMQVVNDLGLYKFLGKKMGHYAFPDFDGILEVSGKKFDKYSLLERKIAQKWGLADKKDNLQQGDVQKQIEKVSNEEKELDDAKKQLDKKKSELDNCLELGVNPKDYKWVVENVGDTYRINDLSYDARNKVIAYIRSTSNHGAAFGGSGGSEYGTNIVIVRDNPANTASLYVKWRDAHDYKKDDRSLNFDKIEISTITDTDVTVELFTGGSYRSTKKFEIKKSEPKERILLNTEEAKQWLNNFEKIEEETKQSSGIKGSMPRYVDLKYSGGTSFGMEGEDTSRTVPYREPMVLDRKMNEKLGLGVFVIMSQIDHDMWKGKQFRYEGWGIDRKGNKTRLFLKNAYQDESRDGENTSVTAEELFDRMLKELNQS